MKIIQAKYQFCIQNWLRRGEKTNCRFPIIMTINKRPFKVESVFRHNHRNIGRHFIFEPVLIFLCFILPFFSQGQLPSSIIQIQGRIVQQNQQQTEPLPGVQVLINDKPYISDEQGGFSLKVPFSDDNISLDIRPQGYKILKPINGEIQLNASVAIFRLDIYVINENADSELAKAAEILQTKLAKSQRDHNFSQRQIAKINQVLFDTLVFFDQQNQAFLREIENLNTEIGQTQEENEDLENRLNQAEENLQRLQLEVETLTEQLYQALEEKFLRQQNYFERISGALNNYLIRAQDINTMLPRLGEYFPMNYSRAGSEVYNTTIESYNEAYLLLNGEKDDLLLGVQHYWEGDFIQEDLASTIDFLTSQVHQDCFLPALTEINGKLRSNKRKQALRAGEEAAILITPQIEELEKAINQSIFLLKENL